MSERRPQDIEIESMAIIDGLLPAGEWRHGEREVVKRLVHASGDPGLAGDVRFHPRAISSAVMALKHGAFVYTDVRMVEIGIDRKRLGQYGGKTSCAIDSSEVIEAARAAGQTRARTAMRLFGGDLDGAIAVVGNAPTALREILALAAAGIARPALVIGMPVGFVDAAESKDALMASDLTYISIAGTRGGSPLAAATVNALLRLTEAGE